MPGAARASEEQTTPTPDASRNVWEPASWTPLVRPITARTRVVHLPAAFARALATGPVRVRSPAAQIDDEDNVWADGTAVVSDDDSAAPENDEHAAAEADALASIDSAIGELRGAVCPKVGTACASDAGWATLNGTARCTTAADALTLLQASERSTAVLVAAEAPVALALRQWADMDERMEFRAFVARGRLIGLCPRRASRGAPETAQMDRVADTVSDWVGDELHARVRGLFGERYVVDVYVDARWRVWVVDFAPWGEPTDSLLFTWEELGTAPWIPRIGRAQFRIGDNGDAILPADGMYHGVPLELRNPDAGSMLAEAARELVEREMDGRKG